MIGEVALQFRAAGEDGGLLTEEVALDLQQ